MADDNGVSPGVRDVGAGDDRWCNSIPRQCAGTSGKSILVSFAGPSRLFAGFGRIIPDERPSISGALISAGTRCDSSEQKQPAAKQKPSRIHAGMLKLKRRKLKC